MRGIQQGGGMWQTPQLPPGLAFAAQFTAPPRAPGVPEESRFSKLVLTFAPASSRHPAALNAAVTAVSRLLLPMIQIPSEGYVPSSLILKRDPPRNQAP